MVSNLSFGRLDHVHEYASARTRLHAACAWCAQGPALHAYITAASNRRLRLTCSIMESIIRAREQYSHLAQYHPLILAETAHG